MHWSVRITFQPQKRKETTNREHAWKKIQQPIAQRPVRLEGDKPT
ncbi:hypothetical protein RISK_003777 [Rhodopirellula islandica]|uniref:Uncharacterized protein n=1 Tax=Rhodopirellula islandica TaxID=595434 RepID=A0A0J1BCF5_RHOIS|nr:hypothetical protein RISK_003777 [Rhodopirellula islandica]